MTDDNNTVDISTTIAQYGQSMVVSGISSSYNFNWIDESSTLTDKAEAEQLYLEAENWLIIGESAGETGKILQPENDSEDWKIMPMEVIDPALAGEWKRQRLWMMDHMDQALGDDAMPALCGSCHGVFWGDQMMSIAKTVSRLRAKHNGSINGMLGNIWEETEPNIVKKLRANRMCKKCYKVSVEARANPWRDNTSDYTVPYQPNLPFVQPPSILNGNSSISPGSSTIAPGGPVVVPTVTASGMAPPPGGWNISYSSTDDDI